MSIHDNVFDLIDEMAEPTGPILSWKAQVHIKQYINNKDLSVSEIGKKIAKKLWKCDLWTWEDLTKDFEQVKTQEALNAWLGLLYEECDYKRILVK